MTAHPLADRAPLLGREEVVSRIDALLAAGRAGRGRLLWLHGDAGIGKSRLLQEVADRAGDATVLRATGWEDQGTPAFWLWTQVLRGAADLRSPEEWGERGARARVLLDGSSSDAAEAGGRFPLFDAVVGVLAGLDGPVVLLLDDLHWVDAGSLHLLLFLVSDLASRPMLVACGWRDHDLSPEADHRDLVATIASRGESWLLEGLGQQDVRALIESTAQRPVADAEARAITARTGGNPLFVSEMARLARSRGLGSVTTVIPETAQATIRRRIARLANPTETVLGAAAVLGASVSRSRLARLLDQDPADLATAVDDLDAAGLVTQDGQRIDFTHDLVRDAVYDSLAAARRRELHLAAARLIERESSAAGPGENDPQAAELAHHLRRALPLVEVAQVVRAAQGAARAALSLQAYEEAGRWCRQALDLVEPGSPDRPDLLLLAGEAALAAGDLDAARASYVQAATMARRTHDAELFARAALGFAIGLSGFEVRLWDREQTELLEEALVRLGGQDSALRAQVMARLSVALSFTASTDRRQALAEEAVGTARKVGDPRALGAALAAHCDAFAGPAYVDLREAEASEILELAARVPDPGLELLALRLRVVSRLERGDLAAADADIARFGRLAGRLRQPFYGWYVPLWQGLRAHLAGDLEEMSRCAQEVRRLGELGGSRNARVLALVQSHWPTIERGLTGNSATTMSSAYAELPELAGDGISVLRFYPGQDDAVRRAALPAFEEVIASLSVDKEWVPNLGAVAMGLWESQIGGRPARFLYELLLPWRHLHLVDGIGAAMCGSIERSLGLLATLLEDFDAAAEHFEQALQVDASIGAWLAVAHVQREYAEMLARRDRPGDRERREKLLGEALGFYRRAGIDERVAEVEAAMGPAAPASSAEAPTPGVFRPDGAFWSVAWRGHGAVLPAIKGMADLAVLLERPDHEVHVLDLVGGAGGSRVPHADLGEVIDETARTAYRARLTVLDEELAEAELTGDVEASEAAARERELLLAQLASAYGLGGKARRAGDPAERARTTVTSRVRDAITRIDRELPDLGRHLRSSVRTGLYCCYSPESPTSWETRPTS